MLADTTVHELAHFLDEARRERREVERLTVQHPDLDLADAYRIQHAGIGLRTGRGETIVGWKMGLTSKAKREQMNLASPVYGVLTDAMAVAAGGAFTVAGGIHPKIEPEIAFLIGPSLRGNLSFEQALSAIVGVAPAMEILDSRYVGFKYFSLPDVVADNSSSSHFVLGGEWLSPNGIDLAALTMTMSVDGVPVQSALSAAISGHPVQSLVQLCAMLAEHGMGLPAGSIVLAGAATVAEPLRAGIAVRLDVAQLGSLEVFAR